MAAQAESQYELNNFDVSGLNQVGNSAHGDLNTNFRPHGNVEGTQQHNNFRPYLYIKDHKSITIFGVVALIVGLVLGLKLGLPKHESSSDPSSSFDPGKVFGCDDLSKTVNYRSNLAIVLSS
ncbi:unnamed protein product [Alternaria alternata]